MRSVVQSIAYGFIIAFLYMATMHTLILLHQNNSYLTIHMKFFSFQTLHSYNADLKIDFNCT